MQTKYQAIIENLSSQIRQGVYLSGDRFYSRSELCRKFNISPLTAVRVQNGLASMGMLKKIQGCGVFVNYQKDGEKPFLQTSCGEIRRIIEFRDSGSSLERGFASRIFSSILRETMEKKIDYSVAYFRTADVSLKDINMLEIDKNAGYLALCNGTTQVFHAVPVLVNPNIHSVLIDSYIPGSHCVYTDSFDGMGKIVDHARNEGCRHFIFCQHSPLENADLYNADRRDGALYHCARHGFACQVRDTKEFSLIADELALLKEKAAVMFPHDDMALRFKKYLAGRKDVKIRPLVTGFDDFAEFESGLEELTTIRVDRERIGKEAVDILLRPNTPMKQIIRIPGKLIIRK